MRNEELRAVSDKMLAMLERLTAVERAKQQLTLGSGEFVTLAREADHLARVVQGLANQQLGHAYEAEERRQRGELDDVRLATIKPRHLDRILADWREAELRLSTAEAGSDAERQAHTDVERLRREYHEAERGKQES